MTDADALEQARDPRTPPAHLAQLATHEDRSVQLAVAANPSTTRNTIVALLDDLPSASDSEDMVAAMAGNASMALWLLDDPAWLCRLDRHVATAMARARALTPTLWSALQGHEEEDVQLALLQSPVAPPDAWKLFDYESPLDPLMLSIRDERDRDALEALIADLGGHPEIETRLLAEPTWLRDMREDSVRALARSPRLTPRLWHALREHPETPVRLALLASPAAPPDAWRHLGFPCPADITLRRLERVHHWTGETPQGARLARAFTADASVESALRDDPEWLRWQPDGVARTLARSRSLTPAIWEALSHHRSQAVRLQLLRSPVAPPDAWTRLALPTEGTWALDDDNLLDGTCMEALSLCPLTTDITELSLSGYTTDTSIAALSRSPAFPRLTRLRLKAIGDRGVLTLARARVFPRLTEIHLSGKHLRPESLAALARSRHLPALTALSLDLWGIDDEFLLALLRSPCAPLLSRLDLGDQLTDAALLALIRSSSTPRLAGLVLSGTSHTSVHALLDSTSSLRQLTELALESCKLGDSEVLALARAPHLAHLSTLMLSANQIGHAGIAALASSPTLGALTTLDVSGNPLGDGAARALAASTTLTRLTSLDLGHTRITPAGMAAIARSASLASLTALELSQLDGGAEIARLVAQSPTLARLERLGFWGSDIGDAGAIALAASPHLRSLRRLNLSHTSVSDAGLVALARSPVLTHLTHLDLSYSQASDEGVLALLRAPFFATLQRLDLDSSHLSLLGHRAVEQAAARHPTLRLA